MKIYTILTILMLSCILVATNTEVAARIGTREYSQQELDDGFAAYLEYRGITEQLSPADEQVLFRKYFEEIIAMHIYNDEIQRRGITFTAGELEDEIRRNPPAGVKQIPELMTNGQFDQNKYEFALFERPEFRLSIMEYSRDVYQYYKLLDIIRAEAQIDSAAIRRAWMREGHSADAKIIYFDYTKFSDITASEEDIYALYEENLEQHRRENGRSLYFVYFAGPGHRSSQGHEQEIIKQSEALYAEAQLIGLPAAARKLGFELQETPYFSPEDQIIRGIGKDPELVQQAFNAPIGSLLPYYQNVMSDIFILQVANETEEYYIPFEVERPIYELQANSLARRQYMQSFVHDFIRNNSSANYLTAAQEADLRVIDAKDIRIDSNIPGIGKVDALNRAILSTAENTFTPLIQNNGFYYLAKVEKLRMRTMQEWNQNKEQILVNALKQAQDEHLNEWYLKRQEELDILWPPRLRQ
nr:hypothetical protein [Candidatus Cloacimonadota bacterium]